MFKQLIQFEHTIGEFVAHFMLPPHTPTNIAKDILLEFIKIVGQIEDQGKAAMEAQAAQNKEAEVTSVPVQDHCVNCE